MRSEKEVNRAIELYSDMVRRLCLIHLKNDADTEDIFQTVFLKYALSSAAFESDEHEKAWLIITASNLCKDTLKKWWRKNENIDDYTSLPQERTETGNDVLDAILALPQDYKDVVYLYYYEGYTTAEIAAHQNCPESTVRSRLSRARKQLMTMLGGADR